jgi:hypothetical protein
MINYYGLKNSTRLPDKFRKILKSDLFKFFKDAYRSFEIDKTDDYIFRLDLLNFYLYCFEENYKHSLKLLQIKQNTQNNFTILKEQNTNSLFFVSDNIIIFHIKFNNFEDFYLSFIYSEFKMLVYKTHSHYIVFCISHKPNEINDIKKFLLYNNNDIRYTILSFFINNNNHKNTNKHEILNKYTEYSNQIIYNDNLKYNGVIALNIDYKSLRINNVKKYSLTFYCTIGLGVDQPQLIPTVNIILEYLKNNTYLPCNYITF